MKIVKIDGVEYSEKKIETKKQIAYQRTRILTEQEKQEQLNQQEIQELNTWLDLRRNIEHPDKETKQARLLELLE